MRMLLIGPPGAGKGTQASRIATAFGMPAISTGDIFRDNVARDTELGRLAREYMDRGAYVPDELTNRLVLDRLAQPDARNGFLLDGFPRTVAQVATLDACLEQDGFELDAVVELEADAEEVVRRLLLRAADQRRSDDSADVIRHRLEVYRETTEPLVRLYGERGVLVKVDGLGPVDAVTQRIFAALQPYDGGAPIDPVLAPAG